jgi:hypothetical protein
VAATPTSRSSSPSSRLRASTSRRTSPGCSVPSPGTRTLVIELWVDADRIVIDSRAFQALLDQSPGAELGPLAPGLAFVDLEQVGAERAGFLTAIAGSGAPDLATIAARLPGSLADVEQVSDDPPTFAGFDVVRRPHRRHGRRRRRGRPVGGRRRGPEPRRRPVARATVRSVDCRTPPLGSPSDQALSIGKS